MRMSAAPVPAIRANAAAAGWCQARAFAAGHRSRTGTGKRAVFAAEAQPLPVDSR